MPAAIACRIAFGAADLERSARLYATIGNRLGDDVARS
jgi:hypothetical protein